ncbi:F-box associated domain [Trema orientale]|uniref:F-box associated domain n=1 Tax=Trema orientale TaxID=63057 RepID=A0A2P5EYS3_TREOI|nr:F-box associated domain [Trema orientale]
MADLPTPILVEIFLKLSAKSVIMSKSACPLIRAVDKSLISRTLYLFDEPEDNAGLDLEDCSCEFGSDRFEKCGRCHISLKLNSKLKIPLRNARLALDKQADFDATNPVKGGTRRKRCDRLYLKPRDHRCSIVNSCNGLLCLSDPLSNEPVAICNPITGEFVFLPKPRRCENDDTFIDCELGFSPKNNQYKVVRIFSRWRLSDPHFGLKLYHSTVAEVHTLGTNSWRRIGNAPHSKYKLAFPTYRNGFLHWFCVSYKIPSCIISFDLDNEQFQPVPPPCFLEGGLMSYVSLGVLRGCLCVCAATSSFYPFDLWIMQEYGVGESWTNVVSIASGDEMRAYAIAHIPSFALLKDILMGTNVEVLNINSRCGKLKLPGETKAVLLEGKQEGDSSDSDSLYRKRELWYDYWWTKCSDINY